MSDYYRLLGVDCDAQPYQIKRAYRRLALRWHPDRPAGDADRFAAISAAYTVLIDPDRRRQYDLERLTAPGEPPGAADGEPGPYTPGGYYGPLRDTLGGLEGLVGDYAAALMAGRLDFSDLGGAITSGDVAELVLRSVFDPPHTRRQRLAARLGALLRERLGLDEE